MSVINFDEMKKEIERKQKKEAIKKKVLEKLKWVDDHKEAIGPALAVGYSIYQGVKRETRQFKKAKERYDIDHRIYDHSLKKQLRLKRKLNNDDLLEIKARKGNGESLTDILNDMKLLK